MNKTNDNGLLNRYTNTEELSAAAQRHFAGDFPNPQRMGCPVPGTLQALVRAERLPDDELQLHLFKCSECFNEYRAEVLVWRQEKELSADAGIGWRAVLDALWNWRIPISATVATMLLLSAGIAFRRTPAPQSNPMRPQPVPQASVVVENSQPEPPGAIPPTPVIAQQQSTTEERLLAVNIDLNNHQSPGTQQRSGGETVPAISLPRAYVRLKLKLPRESASGRYRVSLLDDYLKSIVSGQAVTTDGNYLVVKLNLRHLPKQFYSLSLTQRDEAPYFYRVVLTDP